MDEPTRREGGSQLIYSAGWQVIEERSASTGAKQAQYLWSPVYVDAMVLIDRDSDGNGTLDQRQYALHDANFNVTALANNSGTLSERFEYDPYGKRAVLNADWTPDGDGASDVAFAHGHQGLKYDEAAGLYGSRLRPCTLILGDDPPSAACAAELSYAAHHGFRSLAAASTRGYNPSPRSGRGAQVSKPTGDATDEAHRYAAAAAVAGEVGAGTGEGALFGPSGDLASSSARCESSASCA